MLSEPSPVLNDEERELLDPAPEECFRHAVQRGALSLDQITEGLSSRVAAVVRSVATGERLATLDRESLSREITAPRTRVRSMDLSPTIEPAEATRWQHEPAQGALSQHPQLAQMLSLRILTPDEAIEAAQALDDALGRYLTGTRYAAP